MTTWRSCLLLVSLLTACGTKGLSGPSSPKEAFAEQMAQCHADHHKLGTITVIWHDHNRDDGGKAWAWPGSREISVSRDFVRDATPQDIEMAMAHEVCHLSGIWMQNIADFCAKLAYRDAGCRSEEKE